MEFPLRIPVVRVSAQLCGVFTGPKLPANSSTASLIFSNLAHPVRVPLVVQALPENPPPFGDNGVSHPNACFPGAKRKLEF